MVRKFRGIHSAHNGISIKLFRSEDLVDHPIIGFDDRVINKLA